MIVLSFLVRPEFVEPASAALCGNVALRILLSATALVSGVGKAMDPASNRQAMGDFGVPSRWVEAAARVLPVVEVSLGAAILIDALAPLASLALAFLFALFSLGTYNLLRQRKAPPCNCFGAVHSEPISRFTLIRALGLSAMSLLCYALPLYQLTPGLTSLLLVLLGFVAAGRGVRGWVNQRRSAGPNKKVRRLIVGQRLPTIRTTDGVWLSKILSSHERTLLVLTSPGCGPCQLARVVLSGWAKAVSGELAVIELCREDLTITIQPEEPVIPRYYAKPEDFERFRSRTPGGFLLDKKGSILALPVAGIEEIEALARLALNERFTPPQDG